MTYYYYCVSQSVFHGPRIDGPERAYRLFYMEKRKTFSSGYFRVESGSIVDECDIYTVKELKKKFGIDVRSEGRK